jgi:hypothetical protein
MAIDDRLEIYPANTLENTDEKGVHRYEIAGVPGFDVPLPKFRAEPFQQANLGVAEIQFLLTNCFFEAQKPVVSTLKIVATPHTPDSTGTDLEVLQDKLLSDPHRAVGLMQAVFQDDLFDLLADPIGCVPGAWKSIQQGLGQLRRIS